VGWDGGIKRVNEQDEAAWRVYVLENVPTFSIGNFLELRCQELLDGTVEPLAGLERA
jgi:hypothetical protein